MWRRFSLELIFLAVVAKVWKEHPWPSICLESWSSNSNNAGSDHHWSFLGMFLAVQPPSPILWPSQTFFELFRIILYIYFLLKIARMDSVVCNQVPWYVCVFVYMEAYKHLLKYNTIATGTPPLSPRAVVIYLFIHLTKNIYWAPAMHDAQH